MQEHSKMLRNRQKEDIGTSVRWSDSSSPRSKTLWADASRTSRCAGREGLDPKSRLAISNLLVFPKSWQAEYFMINRSSLAMWGNATGVHKNECNTISDFKIRRVPSVFSFQSSSRVDLEMQFLQSENGWFPQMATHIGVIMIPRSLSVTHVTIWTCCVFLCTL